MNNAQFPGADLEQHEAEAATEPDLDMSDLDDFMSELDRDLKKASKAKKAPNGTSYSAPVSFTQEWFPYSTTLVVCTQECLCGTHLPHVEGLFTVDTSRNGITRFTRIPDQVVPEAYRSLPRTLKHERNTISHCPECFK